MTNDNGIGAKLKGLRNEQVGVAVRRKHFDMQPIFLFTDHVERLGSDGTGAS